jgi:hypothetical protein
MGILLVSDLRGLATLVLVFVAFVLVRPLSGYGAPPPQQADSTGVLNQARALQREFEAIRARHLPDHLGGTGGCDERVGRMCWRYSTDPDWTPEPEPDAVRDARAGLLEGLAVLAASIPGDRWILGQRVRYAVEQRETDQALDWVGPECMAGWGWCAAARGWLLQRRGEYGAALDAFEEAGMAAAAGRARPAGGGNQRDPASGLPGVPTQAEAFRWLADSGAREWIEDGAEMALPEAAFDRDARRSRFWALADPLVLIPGNERYTEHLARLVEVAVMEDSRNPHGIPWGDDLSELHVRYGPEVGWAEARRAGSISGRPSVVGREDPLGREFTPSRDLLEDPFLSEESDWIPEFERPRDAFAVPHAPDLEPATFQLARFWRGDSVRVLGAVAAPAGFPPRHGWRPPVDRSAPPVRGVFVLPESGPEHGPEKGLAEWSGASFPGAAGAVALTLPRGRYLVSVESLDAAAFAAARARFGVDATGPPEGVAAVSDLGLLVSRGPHPASLDEAAERIAPAAFAPSGGQVRVAWELYGRQPGSGAARLQLSVSAGEGNVLRRFGRWLRLVGRPATVRLEWEEPPPAGPDPTFHVVDLDLPEMDPGEYLIELRVTLPGRDPLRAVRGLRVGPPPGPGAR